MDTDTMTTVRLRDGPHDGHFLGFWDGSDVQRLPLANVPPGEEEQDAEYRRTDETEDGLEVFRFVRMVSDPRWKGRVRR